MFFGFFKTQLRKYLNLRRIFGYKRPPFGSFWPFGSKVTPTKIFGKFGPHFFFSTLFVFECLNVQSKIVDLGKTYPTTPRVFRCFPICFPYFGSESGCIHSCSEPLRNQTLQGLRDHEGFELIKRTCFSSNVELRIISETETLLKSYK